MKFTLLFWEYYIRRPHNNDSSLDNLIESSADKWSISGTTDPIGSGKGKKDSSPIGTYDTGSSDIILLLSNKSIDLMVELQVHRSTRTKTNIGSNQMVKMTDTFSMFYLFSFSWSIISIMMLLKVVSQLHRVLSLLKYSLYWTRKIYSFRICPMFPRWNIQIKWFFLFWKVLISFYLLFLLEIILRIVIEAILFKPFLIIFLFKIFDWNL